MKENHVIIEDGKENPTMVSKIALPGSSESETGPEQREILALELARDVQRLRKERANTRWLKKGQRRNLSIMDAFFILRPQDEYPFDNEAARDLLSNVIKIIEKHADHPQRGSVSKDEKMSPDPFLPSLPKAKGWMAEYEEKQDEQAEAFRSRSQTSR